MLRIIGLQHCREMRNYTRRELGKLVGIQTETIVRLENGSLQADPETALRIAAALEVELDELTEPPADLEEGSATEFPGSIVACHDPLGRLVALTLTRWVGHILVRHGELRGQDAVILSTIEEPDEIRVDIEHPNRECYYRLGVLPEPFNRLFLKVCVEYGPEDAFGREAVGFVVTAFPLRRPKVGEGHKWP